MATQAQITVNGLGGNLQSVAINTLVQLNNVGLGGETTYLWSFVDQPDGTADALSATNIVNPTFTPKKEGSYLLKLIVNNGLADQTEDTVVVAVLQLKSLIRIPAAGETFEDDASKGWRKSVNPILQKVDSLLADPGAMVGAAGAAGLARGDVLRASGVATLKSGLPGEEKVPSFTKALATDIENLNEPLFVLEGGVDGSTNPANGDVVKVRLFGRFPSLTGAPAVGDPLFVSDTATIALTPGTFRRQIGTVIAAAGGSYDAFVGEARAFDIAPRLDQLDLTTSLDLRNASPAVSLANAIRLRSNTGRLQVSENAGAWTNVTPAVGVAPARSDEAFLINGSAVGSLPNAVDIKALAAVLTLNRTDANSASTVDLLEFRHTAAGPAAGIGSSLLFTAGASGAPKDAGRVAAYLTDVGGGTEASAISLSTRTGGGALTERVWVSPAGALLVGASVAAGAEVLRVVGGSSRFEGDVSLTEKALLNARFATFSDAVNQQAYVEMAQGSAAGASSANMGRLRYDETAQKWQASENTGAYTNLVASGGNAPADAAYLTNGAVAGLSAEVNIQALAATLAFARDDASTNTVLDLVSLVRTTSGLAAAGIGAGLLFRAENAAGSTEDAARIAATLTNAGGGAEASAIDLATRTGGGAVTVRWRVDAAGDLLPQGGAKAVGASGTRIGTAYGATFDASTSLVLAASGTLTAGANTLVGSVADKLSAAHLAIASQAVGDLLYADSATSFARLADVATGQVLASGGVGVAPAWSATPTVTDLTLTGVLKAAAGAVGAPSVSFSGDLNTGLYSQAADAIGLATNGVERARLDANETASETALLLSVGGATVARVSVGANDSGGAGFRLLRVPN